MRRSRPDVTGAAPLVLVVAWREGFVTAADGAGSQDATNIHAIERPVSGDDERTGPSWRKDGIALEMHVERKTDSCVLRLEPVAPAPTAPVKSPSARLLARPSLARGPRSLSASRYVARVPLPTSTPEVSSCADDGVPCHRCDLRAPGRRERGDTDARRPAPEHAERSCGAARHVERPSP